MALKFNKNGASAVRSGEELSEDFRGSIVDWSSPERGKAEAALPAAS